MAQGLGENLDINIGVNVTGLPQIQQVQTRMKNLNNTIQKSTSQYNANVVATNKWAKGALQQAGYQVGDFAVQVANGTSAVQAFGQQGSQFLGIFGPMGAVIGAVVAIASAVGVAFQKAGNGAKEAAEKTVDLGAAFSALERIDSIKIGENLSRPAKEAAKEYQNLINLMHEAAREQRDAALGAVISGMQQSKEYEKIEARLSRIGQNRNKINEKQAKEAEDFFATQEDLLKVQQLIAAAAGQTRQEAAQNLEKSISTLQTLGLMTPELRQQLDAYAKQAGLLTVVKKKIDDANSATEDAAKSASSLSKQLSGAALAAQSMARALASAPNFLSDMKGRAAVMAAEIGAISAGLSEAAASSAAFRKERELHYNLESATHFEQRQIIEQNIEAEVRQFEANQRLNATLTDMRGLYKDVGNAGGGAMGKIKKGVEALTPEMQRLKDLNKSIEGAFETGFMSIIDGTSSVADAFRSMASSIIKELYRIFVVKRITGLISDAIGFAALPAGGTYTGSFGLPSFPSGDGGGYTGNGARAGGLDGKGGFMAMLHPRETILDHTKGQGGGVIVNQTINVSTGVQQTVRTEIKQLMPQIADAAKSAVVDAKRRGGSYGRAFA